MVGESTGWTIETLKEHFEEIHKMHDAADALAFDKAEKAVKTAMEASEKAVAAAMAASEKAITVAEVNASKWRESANEWRATMSDKDRNFVTKQVLWAYFIGMLGVTLTIAGLVLYTLRFNLGG